MWPRLLKNSDFCEVWHPFLIEADILDPAFANLAAGFVFLAIFSAVFADFYAFIVLGGGLGYKQPKMTTEKWSKSCPLCTQKQTLEAHRFSVYIG